MPICRIIGAAPDHCPIHVNEGDLVIAADGGLARLNENGILPDLIVGDFDSLGFVPDSGNIIRHPPEKDDTDTALAVDEGFKRGFDRFVIYGGIGGRLDHTLANLQTLAGIVNRGGTAFLVGCGNIITVIKNGTLCFDGTQFGMVSVFAHGGNAEGVDENGLKYPLDHAVLTCDTPLGVSNEFTEKPAKITVRNGSLIVMWYADDFDSSSIIIEKN